ncbi:MAG: TRAP transporter small permease [Pigmentiphaga sp.]|nr:TRAP transporter small permease [Pigmentiphaga sp.]
MSLPTRSVSAPGGGLIRAIDQASAWCNRALACLAALALLGLMLITVLDIAMRILGQQVAGIYELVGWLAAAAMGLALGYTQLHKGHVAVTIVTDYLKGRSLAISRLISSILSLGLIAVITYYVGAFGLMQQATGSLSETLRFVVYPWVFILTLGMAGLTLALVADTLRSIVLLVDPNAFDT